MADVAISGAHGFLGWHVRAALFESGETAVAVPLGSAFDRDSAVEAMSGARRLLHLAGVNRGSDEDVAEGNRLFAEQAAEALRAAPEPPRVVVYANSTQSLSPGVYGEAKSEAAKVLERAAADIGAVFQDVLLPNLFGEHGRPFYNAVTATFCQLLAEGRRPTILEDRSLSLLHVQNAADLLLGATSSEQARNLQVELTVSELLEELDVIDAVYREGEIPDVSTPFRRDLFNTYRSYVFPAMAPIALSRHSDPRGAFFETVRSHGGAGQSAFSTTVPGVTRGDHFHRRKIERFVVLAGSATIALRRVLTTEVIEFAVTGDEPVAVDMPTMWSHCITNTGAEPLFTSFWANELFDPGAPDTIAEAVHCQEN